jgi:pantoate--beta-alanine ligase
MEIFHTVTSMTEASRALRQDGKRVAFVPTMGALHEGHATLMRRARETGAAVVVSIYVNPTQFGPKEDFSKYPRMFEADCGICEREGVAAVFAPTDAEMYPDGLASVSTWVDESQIARRLEGERRPGHFRGVCTVVAKLFNIVQPDAAFFGQKDYQQLKVIQRMVRDLRYPIEIVPVPSVREADGLAMSSRNRYLNAEERSQALVVARALKAARELFLKGEQNPERLEAAMREQVAGASLARLDYAEVVGGETLEQIPQARSGDVALIAAFVGATRLIDNLFL